MTLSRPILALLAFGVLAVAGVAAGLAEPPTLRGQDAPSAPLRASAQSHNNSSHDNDTKPPKNETSDPLPAPVVTPENQTVVARYDQEARFEVVVSNEADATQNVSVQAYAPLGWSVQLDAYDGVLAPGESVTVTGGVTTLSPTFQRDNVTLRVQGRDASAYATVQVCFTSFSLFDPCPAPSNQTQPPKNETKPPKNETGGNNTKPPKNDTGGNQTQPPKNETGGNQTQPPQNGTAESSGPVLMGAPLAEPGLLAVETRDARAEARVGERDGGGGAVVARASVAKESPTLI